MATDEAALSAQQVVVQEKLIMTMNLSDLNPHQLLVRQRLEFEQRKRRIEEMKKQLIVSISPKVIIIYNMYIL